jgi:dienelactone hydrolase
MRLAGRAFRAACRTAILVALGLALLVATPVPDAVAGIAAERELRLSPKSPAQRLRVQRALRRSVFGSASLPADTATIQGDGHLSVPVDVGLTSYGTLFRAERPNGTLIILHGGHHGPGRLADAYAEPLRRLLAQGFDVVTLAMPLNSENQAAGFGGLATLPCWNLPDRTDHDLFACLPHPLRSFVLPVVAVVNTLGGQYRRVGMIGLSGGGWTTVLAAAMDPRIARSYPVAGSWPLYLRLRNGEQNTLGDFEQRYSPMLKAASYLDMYALARRQLQIFIEHDPCCFAGSAFRSYLPAVQGVSPTFRALMDRTTADHEISSWAMDRILDDLKH